MNLVDKNNILSTTVIFKSFRNYIQLNSDIKFRFFLSHEHQQDGAKQNIYL